MRKRRHDAAPNEEWVLMYRQGLSGQRIAVVVGRPEKTVGYHLRIARTLDPGLERVHDLARPRIPAASRAIMDGLIRFVQETGEFPSTSSDDPKVQQLGRWISTRRLEAARGVLRAEYRERLDEAAPGWEVQRKRRREDTQWNRKFESLITYMEAGNDWPRSRTGETDEERAHGRWLGTQRHLLSKGELFPDRQRRLDLALPGWVRGRKG